MKRVINAFLVATMGIILALADITPSYCSTGREVFRKEMRNYRRLQSSKS